MVCHHGQKKPVAKTEHVLKMLHRLDGNIGGKVDQEVHPDPGAEHGQHPEDEVEDGDHQQQYQPEPEDDVDLVIDHVDREDTQSIKSRIVVDCEHQRIK